MAKPPRKSKVVGYCQELQESARRAAAKSPFLESLVLLEQNARAALDSETAGSVVKVEAATVLDFLGGLRDACNSGDGMAAIRFAFHLGMLDERLRTRVMADPFVVEGIGKTAAHRVKGEVRKGTTESKYRIIQQWIAARQRKFPDASLTSHKQAAMRDTELKSTLHVKTLSKATIDRALATAAKKTQRK